MRTKIYIVFRKILKINDYDRAPMWLNFIFYPIMTYICNYSRVYYSPINNTITIDKITIPLNLIRYIKTGNKRDIDVYHHFDECDGVMFIDKSISMEKE